MSTTQVRKRLTAFERREQIVAASIGVIVRLGIHAFRVRDVADAAGVSQPLVSTHFRDRNELIVAAFEMSDIHAFAQIEALAEAEPTGRRRAVRCVLECIGLDELRTESWDLWLQAWSYGRFSELVRDSLAARQQAWIDLIARFVEQGRDDGSVDRSVAADAVARLLVTAVDGVSASLRCGVLAEVEAISICTDTLDAVLLRPGRPQD